MRLKGFVFRFLGTIRNHIMAKKRVIRSSRRAIRPSRRVSKKNNVSKSQKDFRIVGIGASAGGFKAITDVIGNLRHPTGMAFVFVSHLPTAPKSTLTDLLKSK